MLVVLKKWASFPAAKIDALVFNTYSIRCLINIHILYEKVNPNDLPTYENGAVSTYANKCPKQLFGCEHSFEANCHTGEYPPCEKLADIKCRFGKEIDSNNLH